MQTIRIMLTMAALALLSAAALAQAPATGRLLVATPDLDDPEFERTVLLIIHHGEDGTLGVYINRPTWVSAAEAFPAIEPMQGFDGDLYRGGPVSPTQLLVLARSRDDLPVESTAVLDGVQLAADLNLLADESLARAGDDQIRVYAGHAVWEAGQLDAEIGTGSWHVVDGSADLVFSRRPRELWTELQLVSDIELSARATSD